MYITYMMYKILYYVMFSIEKTDMYFVWDIPVFLTTVNGWITPRQDLRVAHRSYVGL
jgi:hypothetical protein